MDSSIFASKSGGIVMGGMGVRLPERPNLSPLAPERARPFCESFHKRRGLAQRCLSAIPSLEEESWEEEEEDSRLEMFSLEEEESWEEEEDEESWDEEEPEWSF